MMEQKKRSNNKLNQSQDKSVPTADAPPKNALQQSIEMPKKPTKYSKEINGPKGLEPTRYGDWESKGRCYDF